MNYVYQYPRYKITCDVACVVGGRKLLVIKRGVEPCKGMISLPGGNLNPDELLVDCAIRELFEETGIVATREQLKLVNNFDALDRSSGDRSVSCLYLLSLDFTPLVTVGDDTVGYAWITADQMNTIDWAFDCHEMAASVLK